MDDSGSHREKRMRKCSSPFLHQLSLFMTIGKGINLCKAPRIEATMATASGESFEPLNDYSMPVSYSVPLEPLEGVRKWNRSNSHGSDKSLEMASEGIEDSLDFRLQAVDKEGNKKISLWHDVSLVHLDDNKDDTPYMNFVCEIPKFSRYVVVRRVVAD